MGEIDWRTPQCVTGHQRSYAGTVPAPWPCRSHRFGITCPPFGCCNLTHVSESTLFVPPLDERTPPDMGPTDRADLDCLSAAGLRRGSDRLCGRSDCRLPA